MFMPQHSKAIIILASKLSKTVANALVQHTHTHQPTTKLGVSFSKYFISHLENKYTSITINYHLLHWGGLYQMECQLSFIASYSQGQRATLQNKEYKKTLALNWYYVFCIFVYLTSVKIIYDLFLQN